MVVALIKARNTPLLHTRQRQARHPGRGSVAAEALVQGGLERRALLFSSEENPIVSDVAANPAAHCIAWWARSL